MTTSIIERTLELIKQYEQISPIVDDILHIRDKHGEKTIITKASLAEKLNCRDENNKISVKVCNDEYIKPEKQKIAQFIFDNIKIIVSKQGKPEHKQKLSKYEYNEGIKSNLNRNADDIIRECKQILVDIDVTILVPTTTFEPIEVDGVQLGMKMKGDEEPSIVEERMRDKW